MHRFVFIVLYLIGKPTFAGEVITFHRPQQQLTELVSNKKVASLSGLIFLSLSRGYAAPDINAWSADKTILLVVSPEVGNTRTANVTQLRPTKAIQVDIYIESQKFHSEGRFSTFFEPQLEVVTDMSFRDLRRSPSYVFIPRTEIVHVIDGRKVKFAGATLLITLGPPANPLSLHAIQAYLTKLFKAYHVQVVD